MVSMKDIALRCGVSVATVSKALNGYSDIGEETKKMVKEAAAELGYFPNSAARALKTNRTYNIGVLFVDGANSGLTHEYFANVLDNVKVYVERKGYDITFINHHIGTRAMSYYEHCRYRGVDGVVIACVDFDEPEVIELINSDIPVVTIDHIFNNRTAIMSDNIGGIRDLVTYIHSMGHHNIAYIHGADSSVTRDRVTSFYKTMEELGLSISPEYVKEGIYHDTDSAARLTKELLGLKTRPTCIIYPDDFACIGGINEIKEQGLTIPEDISVVGYDGLHFTQVLEPKLTTLKQDTISLGKAAAEQLINLIERPKTTLITREIVKGKLVPGNSVKKLP